MEGAQSAVQELAAWLEQGPERAQVERVELEEQPVQGVTGFVVRR